MDNGALKEYYARKRFYGIRHIRQEIFWERVKLGGKDECWPGLDIPDKDGYGHFRLDCDGDALSPTAHRVAWEMINGPLPKGMWALHKCNNRLCVNPAHIYAGTPKQNSADRDERYARGEIKMRDYPPGAHRNRKKKITR